MLPTNFLQPLISGRTLSPKEIEQKNLEFNSLNISEQEKLWEELHGYFKNAPELDQKYFWSYFRWYTELSWMSFVNRDRDFVIRFAFTRQVPLALLLGIDVWKEFIWYLNSHAFKEREMEVFYNNVKEAFFKSSAVVGVWQGKTLLVSDLVKEIEIINQRKDSLRLAEILTRLQEILFPKDLETQSTLQKYVLVDSEIVVNLFVDLINFFIGVQSEQIVALVDGLIHGEKFEVIQELLATKAETESVESATNASQIPPTLESKEVIQNPTLSTPASFKQKNSLTTENKSVTAQVTKNSPSAITRPTNREIKKMIEELFPPNPQGNIVEFERVIAMLNTLADRYKDSSIRDLYFYNEKDGNFYWNENLIK